MRAQTSRVEHKPTTCEDIRSLPRSSSRPAFFSIHSTMVVVQSVPSTSKAPRKNRRTISKKKAPRVVGDDALDRQHETTNVPPKATERAQDEDILIDVDGVDIAPP